MLAVTILGNNSAVPAYDRHPTAQIVQTAEHMFLVDCGEGTQMQMNALKVRRSRINHIFISHLHGDHYFGLIGLLNSFALNNRVADLHIYAPAELEAIIQIQLNAASARLPYPCFFHDLEGEGILFEDRKMEVRSFKVKHRIDCWGFLFREKKNPRKIHLQKVRKYKIPPSFFDNLHQGENYVTPDKKVISNTELTVATTPAKSYAYCADTAYFEELCAKIKGVDLIYHETTYLHDLEQKANSRFHSTSKQAATIARKANVKRLIIGHFSSMYEDLENFKTEACEIFENTELAMEGVCFIV